MYTLTDTARAGIAALAALALAWNGFVKKRRSTGTLPLPPGPTPLPIIGNVRGIDVNTPWISYAEWGAVYGGLVYSRLFGLEIIIVNSEKIARDLLDLRSRNYSNRPEFPTNELIGLDFNTVLLPYSATWRLHRRIFHQSFRQDAAHYYHPMQMKKAHQLLINIFNDPANYIAHLQTHSSSIIMSAAYDYDAAPSGDRLVSLIQKALRISSELLRPEAAAVFSAFPSLLLLPAWFPGMKLKRQAALSKQYMAEWPEIPFQHVQQNMAAGTAAPSMVCNFLKKIEGNDESNELKKATKESAATAFGAGSDTTTSTLHVFVMAMVLFPHVQERAQAVIDSVTGENRLPSFGDRPAMPYIDAVFREVLRWYPVLPLAVAHNASSDDVYNGFLIPKGASLVPNLWAMSRNEDKYPNASEFNPERFLTAEGELTDDTVSFAWGFGRRICPGRHLADASLWSAMVSLLATFNFTKARDSEGNPIGFEPQWIAGVTLRPRPFPCEISPRSKDMNLDTLTQLIGSNE
ncbi:cytochrome P450 [Leucogyrophana mollusca]|uniref:Cytochrome P450 n=1 Tax=Leucogyrophana mollusca TaxID=85980 RepID=A0ACB8BLB5_9AGAM|nr:cytochrome P450 [Leucogyrophana mollusca]